MKAITKLTDYNIEEIATDINKLKELKEELIYNNDYYDEYNIEDEIYKGLGESYNDKTISALQQKINEGLNELYGTKFQFTEDLEMDVDNLLNFLNDDMKYLELTDKLNEYEL